MQQEQKESYSGRPGVWVHFRWKGLSWLKRYREPVLSSLKTPFLHPAIGMRPGTGDSKNVVAKLLDKTDVCSGIDNFLRSPV